MTSRIQLALNVSDLDTAADHYARMFDAVPHKRRPGYVNFEIADPPLKLVLFEHADADRALNHLGVELVDEDAVRAVADRFEAAGLETRSSTGEVCCHAEQSKVYVSTPDVPLEMWEFYAITDDEPSTGTVVVDSGEDAAGSAVTASTPCCATSDSGGSGTVEGGGCCA